MGDDPGDAPPRRLSAEPVTAVCTEHGEGAVWDAARGVLWFVDLLQGGLMQYRPPGAGTPRAGTPDAGTPGGTSGGTVSRRVLGPVLACVRPRRSGGLVVALEQSFALLDEADLAPAAPEFPDAAPAGMHVLPAAWQDAAGAPRRRFNDGGCDPAGRFWMGTMAYDETPGAGMLLRLDPDGSVTTVLDGVTISNGLSFAADGRSAYYVDTPTSRIDVLDVDPERGEVVGRRPFVQIPSEAGFPDGIATDAEGGVWVALWGGSAVRRYDADGRLDAVVDVPARQVTCPAFGGPDGTDLYVTTSRHGLAPHEDPLAGALFRVGAGVAGAPVLPFGG